MKVDRTLGLFSSGNFIAKRVWVLEHTPIVQIYGTEPMLEYLFLLNKALADPPQVSLRQHINDKPAR